MKNPWLSLPESAPYVLPCDEAVVEAFNERASIKHRLQLDCLPEPFIGRPDAPVLLLNANPGHSEKNAAEHSDTDFQALIRRNLEHTEYEWPFYLLHPDFAYGGFRWWAKRLRRLIEATSAEAVARNLLCVELHGYHSKNFRKIRGGLPSTAYSHFLVQNALSRGAKIVVLRSYRRWCEAIPGLADRDLIRTANPQSAYVSPGNCDRFDELVEAINRS